MGCRQAVRQRTLTPSLRRFESFQPSIYLPEKARGDFFIEVFMKEVMTMRKYGILAIILSVTLSITACTGTAGEPGLPEAVSEAAPSETPEAAKEKETEEKSEAVTEEASGAASKAGEETGKTETKYPDREYADKTDASLSSTEYTRTRGEDAKSGDNVDTSIYREKGNIVKIKTEDYGSDGLITDEYYYNGDKVVYMKQHKTDIYGIGSTYDEADLSDIKADYTAGILEKAEKALAEAKKNKGNAVLYGYAGDEQGGVLQNVTVTLRNVAGDYNAEAVTDGDGYYSFEVPQKEDTYNLTYTYGSYAVSSLNDVHIIPGTPEYSLGKVYVAPEGQGVHDTDVYLLNPNTRSPEKLKDGEYLAVISAEDPGMRLRLVNTDDQSTETGNQLKFDPSKSKAGYAVFVEDGTYLGKDDMAGTIGRTYVNVTIFDKDGIKAAFLEPAGRLGTLWKVCTTDKTAGISQSGMLYSDSNGWIGK